MNLHRRGQPSLPRLFSCRFFPNHFQSSHPEGQEPDKDLHLGEIYITNPQIIINYLNKPEETAETIIEQDGKRWLLTGDIGFMDDKKHITIRDRKKQLIKYPL